VGGDIKGGVFQAANMQVAGLDAADGPVTLGYRAEDAQIVDTAGQINADVYTMELLGDATMVTVRAGKSLVTVKAGKEYRAGIGDAVSITVPSEICHLFDANTGERMGE
jgi:multiple sugar transport system ATP-binding protein